MFYEEDTFKRRMVKEKKIDELCYDDYRVDADGSDYRICNINRDSYDSNNDTIAIEELETLAKEY